MMVRPKHGKQKTLEAQAKFFMVTLLLVLVVYAFGCLLLLRRDSERAMQEADQMMQLYTNELDNRFLRLSRSLFSTMMEKNKQSSVFWTYVNMMQDSTGSDTYPIGMLREEYLSYNWEYGKEYRVFLYLKSQDNLYQLSISEEGTYLISRELAQEIKGQIEELQDEVYYVKKKWKIFSSEGQNYMCKIAQNDDIYLGCIVNVKSILEPFSGITMGKNGYVSLVDEQGRSVGSLTSEGISNSEEHEFTKGRYAILKKLSQAPFVIEMQISSDYLLRTMIRMVVILVILAVVLIVAGILIFQHLMRNILKPLEGFINNLQRYDEGEMEYRLTESNLLELEQLDEKFRKMIHQIRRLKITLYEEELKKQKIEMDFLKLQIRPHFYLNCLNFIYSMIDLRQYENAQTMSRITSDYLAYIFRNSSENVAVSMEAEHCRNYLKILLLRYPESFEYYFEVHEEVRDAAIFPFLIQVFVENSAKHALTLDKKILLCTTVYPEEREDGTYVNIYVSDTGNGFPPDILEKLQHGEGIQEGGKHVGIANCLKRFRYYYGTKGEMNFANSPLGGAIVDIHIPYVRCERNNQ